jgi:DNA polymerase-3 subunit epsilon
MTRRIAIDIETSGLDPAFGGEIILICAVELLEGGGFGAHFQRWVKPFRPLMPLTEDLTGISNLKLANAPIFDDIVESFLAFTADSELVCSNAGFDRKFLNHALINLQLPTLPLERFVDLLNEVPSEFREHSTDGIYKYAGVEQCISGKPSYEVARLYWALANL